MAEQTDAEIIASSLDDPSRFAAVFDRHYTAIYGYLQRRAGASAAEDLASETFLVALKRRARFDSSRDSARPWLLGIATNLARRLWRQENRQLRAYARSGVDPLSPGAGEAENSRLDALNRGPELAEALLALSRRDRDVLLLYAYEDLTYEEIASALEIPVGTVRSRLNRARSQIRELLANDRASTDGWPLRQETR